MSRTVVTQRDLGADVPIDKSAGPLAEATPDDYTARLLKYIPTEIIALFLMLDGIIRAANEGGGPLDWTVFLVLLIGTPLYLYRQQRVNKPIQLAISTGAFAVWVFAVGGPFPALGWYKPVYGSVILPLYTFLVPLVEP